MCARPGHVTLSATSLPVPGRVAGGGLSSGDIVGIVFGVVAALALIGIVGFVVAMRLRWSPSHRAVVSWAKKPAAFVRGTPLSCLRDGPLESGGKAGVESSLAAIYPN